jgi:hypothetical protein
MDGQDVKFLSVKQDLGLLSFNLGKEDELVIRQARNRGEAQSQKACAFAESPRRLRTCDCRSLAGGRFGTISELLNRSKDT